jgi:hypothetical protein
MRHFTAPPTIEVAGYMTGVFVDNLQSHETLPVFEKYGLINLDPASWYPTAKFMDAMNEIVNGGNLTSNFVAIGMEVGKTVPLPPEMPNPTLGEVLQIWEGMYYAVHRGHKNGDMGHIAVEKVSPTHYSITLTDLYPDDFSYGIIYGYARRFLPHGTAFKVFYDTERPNRDQHGADSTVIHVSWE